MAVATDVCQVVDLSDAVWLSLGEASLPTVVADRVCPVAGPHVIHGQIAQTTMIVTHRIVSATSHLEGGSSSCWSHLLVIVFLSVAVATIVLMPFLRRWLVDAANDRCPVVATWSRVAVDE